MIPQPIEVPIGGAIRFAVGSSDGIRSNTWTVVGGSAKHDIYVAQRASMHAYKLSLHKSGDWRIAWTTQQAEKLGIEPGDRVTHSFRPSEEMSPGVQLVAAVMIPASSLQPPFTEQQPKGGRISWWPAPNEGRAIRFNVLLMSPHADLATTFDVVGEVGRVALPGGYAAWILADEGETSAAGEADWSEQRQAVFGRSTPGFDPGGPLAHKAGASIGYLPPGTPVMVDLGGVGVDSTDPAGTVNVYPPGWRG